MRNAYERICGRQILAILYVLFARLAHLPAAPILYLGTQTRAVQRSAAQRRAGDPTVCWSFARLTLRIVIIIICVYTRTYEYTHYEAPEICVKNSKFVRNERKKVATGTYIYSSRWNSDLRFTIYSYRIRTLLQHFPLFSGRVVT